MRYLLILLLAACHPAPAPAARAPVPAAAPATGGASDFVKAQDAYDAHQWATCAELFTRAAVQPLPAPVSASTAYYSAACCYAQGGQTDRAFATLEQAISAGFGYRPTAEGDGDLVSLHQDPRWAAALADMDHAMEASETSFGDPALRKELLDMREADQAARKSMIAAPTDAALREQVAAVDRKDLARMKEIVAKVGWPGQKLVGGAGADAAWLLVQHADRDVAFQKQCLTLLERAVASGDARPANYAYLYDRVAVAEKRPQRYGTQYSDGQPAPLEDPAHVDRRRRSVGLGTMAAYREEMRAAYGSSIK